MERQQFQRGQHQNALYGGTSREGALSMRSTNPTYMSSQAERHAFAYEQLFNEELPGANQKPILNTDDQDSMSHFFDNPDTAGMFGYTFTHDDSAGGGAAAADSHRPWPFHGGNGPNHASNPTTGPPSGYMTQGNGQVNVAGGQSRTPVTSGDWSRQLQQPMMNNEDFHAASFLQGLRGQTLPDGSQAMDVGNFPNASWGNFAVSANGNTNMPPHFRTSNGGVQQIPFTAGGQHVASSFVPQDIQQMQQIPWQSPMSHMQHPQALPSQQQQLQQQTAARARHLSLDTNTQFVRPASTPIRNDGSQSAVLPTEKPRPAPVRFGSDNNFSVHGYHGPELNSSVEQQEKVSNLLNIPLAFQAAKHGRPQPQDNNLARTGSSGTNFSPGGIGGLPVHNSMSGAQVSNDSWGAMPPPNQSGKPDLDAFFPDAQARKRRKSKHDLEDEAEYVPPEERAEGGNMASRGSKPATITGSDDEADGGKSSSKRQKATYSGGASFSDQSVSPGPGDDDDMDQGGSKKKARSSKKQRENLSESQKRQNHIQSEKKRRDVINNGYSELSKLVPCLSNGKSGLSRSESLQEIASYLEVIVTGTANVMTMLGISESDLATASGSS